MEEIWKDIDKDYAVSNYGNVKSKERTVIQPYKGKTRVKNWKERILSKQPSPDYIRVKLHNKYVSLSHLVANAFLDNPNNYTTVHHKDKNINNNNVENLEWIDEIKHNELHISELCKKVYQYTLDGKLVKEWESTNECGRNGFNQAHISDCCLGKRKTHKGYLWSYSLMS